jgi:hypothetical protein
VYLGVRMRFDMGKRFAVGDEVAFRKRRSSHGFNKGVIDWIGDGYLTFLVKPATETTYAVYCSAQRIKGRWYAHRPYQGYKERLFRAKQ